MCLVHVTLGYYNAVVRTPDTRIFVILLYHVINLTVYLDMESGKYRQVVKLSDLAVPWEKTTVTLFLGCRGLHQCPQKEMEGGSPEKTGEE